MPILTLLVGNVGSGKSLIASKLHNLYGDVIVNMDALQASVSGGTYNAYEPKKKIIYEAAEEALIRTALSNGFPVTVDRTNMTREARKRFIDMAKDYNTTVMAYDWGPGTEEGLRRRQANGRELEPEAWKNIWERFKALYELPMNGEGIGLIQPPPKSYKFYAFDFDGTISSKADFPGTGELNKGIADYINRLYGDLSNIIIIWTCRNEESLPQMRRFLRDNKVLYDFINENPLVDNGSPKIFAHEYWDNRNMIME